MVEADATKRVCPNGHIIDAAWEVCPFCPSERRSPPELAKTVRIEERRASTPPPPSPARKTEIIGGQSMLLEGIGWLVAVRGARRGQIQRLDRERMTVGAGRDSDIALDDARVSDHHASIRFRNKVFILTDLDSTNGTYVNDDRISHHALADGDRVRFGSSEWVFKYVAFEAS